MLKTDAASEVLQWLKTRHIESARLATGSVYTLRLIVKSRRDALVTVLQLIEATGLRPEC